MNSKNLFFFLTATVLLFASCSKDEPGNLVSDPDPEEKTYYFLGIEAATDPSTDVLSPAISLMQGTVSPVNNGFEQPAWMTYIQGVDQIIAGGYTSAPEFISYEMVNGELIKGGSFFTDLTIYAFTVVDEATMVMIGSAREGLSDKKIYLVNTNTMSIEKTVLSAFGNVAGDSLLAFPVDVVVRGNKMFVAYYHIHASGDFSTPLSNEAHVAVFNYPELTLEKIISDNRTSNIGRYYTNNALETDENGNIYSFSPSSLASGYSPVPGNNSAVLRIKQGETDFDASFHIDFETLSGGYKINDLYYVADGKAVVRVLQEDENDPAYLWATYAPVSDKPLLKTGILDLHNQTFTLLDEIPLAGGGWNSAILVEGTRLYLGVSNSSYAGIYVIDVAMGTATEGAKIDGNYAKSILSLSE